MGDVADVHSMVPDNIRWEEQIKIIQEATVIITAPGGGAFAAWLARPGTSIIILERNYDGKSERYRSAMYITHILTQI